MDLFDYNTTTYNFIFDDAHFGYQLNFSTSCIFCSDQHGHNFLISWHDPLLTTIIPPSATISSSAHGLVLYQHQHPNNTTTTYSVGNPFFNNPYSSICFTPLPPPPRLHHPDTHVALTTQFNPTAVYHVVCILPETKPTGVTNYIIDFYSSDQPNRWWTTSLLNIHLNGDPHRFIVPNTGISCRRWAYWLSWGQDTSTLNTMVVRVDVKSRVDPLVYPLLSYLEMPASVQAYDDVRMKLGRVGDRVGLVVVNESLRRVELFFLTEISINPHDDNDRLIMKGWQPFRPVLDVVLNPQMGETAVVVVGHNRIMCREMPRPIRFQSSKMEVLLVVGGRRLVIWESSMINPSMSRVVVGDGEFTEGAAPYILTCSIPHVCSSSLPSHFEI